MFLTSYPLADLLLLAIVGLICWHSWWLHKRGRFFVFDPLNAFWAGVLVIYVSEPIQHYQTFVFWHQEGTFEWTLFWIFFGLIWVIVGYERPLGAKLGRHIPALPPRLDSTKFFVAGIVLVAIGVTGYLYIIYTSGGPTVWLSAPRGGTNEEKVSAYFAQMVTFLFPGMAILIFNAYLQKISFLRKVVIGTIVLLGLAWFIYLGSRTRTGMLVCIAFSAGYLVKRRNPSLVLVGFVAVGLLVLTEFMAVYRGQFTNLSLNLDEVDREEARANVLPKWLGGKRNEISRGFFFNVAMTAVELSPEKVPFDYGYSLLEFVTRPIPRKLWPEGKRYPLLEAHQNLYREGELTTFERPESGLLAGPSLTFVGNWWHIGGPVGLIIGGLAVGIIFRFMRSFYDRSPGSQGDLLIYSQLIMTGYTEAVSDPFYWFYNLPFALGPLLIIIYLCRLAPPRMRKRRGQAAAAPASSPQDTSLLGVEHSLTPAPSSARRRKYSGSQRRYFSRRRT